MSVARALSVVLAAGRSLSASERVVANSQSPIRREVFDAVRRGLLQAYIERTPSFAKAVVMLDDLKASAVYNDHVAFRSFVDSKGRSGLSWLLRFFTAFGYARQDDVAIPGMPLNATWLEPPESTDWPKVFISELRTSELPEETAAIIYRHVDGFYDLQRMEAALKECSPEKLVALLERLPFAPTAAEEAKVREVSEYGAWTLTHGHRFNHATILLNGLSLEKEGISSLASLNELLRRADFMMVPASGADGYTQGSRSLSLEQSSTVADKQPMTFACGTVREVPCSFLELIHRHDGFRGFLGQNAKGIFTSTDQSRSLEAQAAPAAM
eukprot:CAMPEP_0178449060 /NCGR_PEP_ID=MMETSP0689_2-20121128/42332_1 /TAXON_ID=160604 /ORGANISM="Amphidinium massartii, Strain CS-259" /LENGTH=326 /DNA_ID=CAMNT_0020074319 /DNA_START=57 /DNA_END=1037 /DNA_ORIENTATION=-